MDWLELISIGAGMYVLYAAFLLKGKGVLTKGIFVSSKVNPDRIRDREGFISAMFPIAVLMGLALITSGAIGMLIDKTTSFGYYVSLASIGVAFLLVVLFVLRLRSCEDKFY